MGRKFLKLWWCIICTLPLVANLSDEKLVAQNWAVFSGITWWVVAQNVLVIVGVIFTYAGLVKIAPFLKWSWMLLFQSFSSDDGKPSQGTNISLIPMQVKYFGLVFAAIFAFNLPQLTHQEEVWFREGLQTWQQGLLWSLLFGLVHCLVGVPLGAGLAITVAGLWFTHTYFMGGVELSTIHHTTYDLILVSLLFIGMTVEHIYHLLPERYKTQEEA